MTPVERLVREHADLAYALADGFYLPGSEKQDVQQEALIGLFVAARAYDPGKGSSFRTFAALVIRRRLGTALKLALREKHRPLTESVRAAWNEDGELTDIYEMVSGPRSRDTLDVVVDRENVAELRSRLPALSEMERAAVRDYVNGVPYVVGGVKDKSMDNALQRAREKLREAA